MITTLKLGLTLDWLRVKLVDSLLVVLLRDISLDLHSGSQQALVEGFRSEMESLNLLETVGQRRVSRVWKLARRHSLPIQLANVIRRQLFQRCVDYNRVLRSFG